VTYPAPQMTLPFSCSFWVYFTAVTGGNQVIGGLGNSTTASWSFEYCINSSFTSIWCSETIFGY